MNEHKVREQAKAEAERQFLQALSAGQIHVLDRLSQWVEEGSKVLYKSPLDLVFDVVRVKPVMDPNVPPGLMTVTLAVKFDAVIQANSPWQAGIVVAGPSKSEGEPADRHVISTQHSDGSLTLKIPDPESGSNHAEPVRNWSMAPSALWRRMFGR